MVLVQYKQCWIPKHLQLDPKFLCLRAVSAVPAYDDMLEAAILKLGIAVLIAVASRRLDSGARERGIGEMEERGKELAAMADVIKHPLTTPVELCFDWANELPHLAPDLAEAMMTRSSRESSPSSGTPAVEEVEFYLVVFRSIRKASADTVTLYSADAAAHEESRLSGGLLKYWYGVMNERRECMGMCIWATREDAVTAIHKPAHRQAMQLASSFYDMYTLERYSLKLDAALRPTFTLLGRISSSSRSHPSPSSMHHQTPQPRHASRHLLAHSIPFLELPTPTLPFSDPSPNSAPYF